MANVLEKREVFYLITEVTKLKFSLRNYVALSPPDFKPWTNVRFTDTDFVSWLYFAGHRIRASVASKQNDDSIKEINK